MNHSEVVEQLAVERYLLDELTPDAREAFEEHLFDCQECALDLRAGTLFVDEVKAQLPGIPEKSIVADRGPKAKAVSWLSWMRPMFVAPAFAALLGIVVFQNVVSFPALRQAANQPRLAPLTELRPATRGAERQKLNADRSHGAALSVDLPVDQGTTAASSYSIELQDAQGSTVWATKILAGAREAQDDQKLTLFIPGTTLKSGTYSLSIAGLSPQGEHISAEQYLFDIVVTN
jgi:anti-sigma factor RsiW